MTKLNDEIAREIKPKNKSFWNTDEKEDETMISKTLKRTY